MYTFPLATVGTVNVTAKPALSAAAIELFQSSLVRFVALKACKTAGPHPGDCGVQYLLLSSAQRIPLLAPFDETEGVAPGNPNEAAV